MEQTPQRAIHLPAFPFRIDPEEARSYRAALGLSRNRVPHAMALRALAGGAVAETLRTVAQGRLCIHLAQDIRAEAELQSGIEYLCTVSIIPLGPNRVSIEQSLCTEDDTLILTLQAEIALVAP